MYKQMNPEGVASLPGGYTNKNSNNRKIKSARWTMPRAPSVSFFPASLQHKEASAEERAPAMETTFKWRGLVISDIIIIRRTLL